LEADELIDNALLEHVVSSSHHIVASICMNTTRRTGEITKTAFRRLGTGTYIQKYMAAHSSQWSASVATNIVRDATDREPRY